MSPFYKPFLDADPPALDFLNSAEPPLNIVPDLAPRFNGIDVQYLPCSCMEGCDTGVRVWREDNFVRISTGPESVNPLSSEYPIPALDAGRVEHLIITLAGFINRHVTLTEKGQTDGNHAGH